MRIFRVKDKQGSMAWSFLMATDKKAAKKAVSKDMDVTEWNVCMGPRHGKIPGTDINVESALATHLIDGVPMCDVCYSQQTMSVNDRLNRLEELVVELRRDLFFHTENGHGYDND